MHIIRAQTPEERELEKKKAEIATLEPRLAQRELALETLRAALAAFERKYLRQVGQRYAELDEVEARIAEALVRLRPEDEPTKRNAQDERHRATRSAREAESVQHSPGPDCFVPSEELKGLYREVAKAVHPDLADGEDERGRRHRFMAEANQAYADGDPERLAQILREWRESPESVKGDSPGAELVRVIRRIARVEERLRAIDAEIRGLEASDLFKLRSQAEEAQTHGTDLLAEMAARLDDRIAKAKERLAALSNAG